MTPKEKAKKTKVFENKFFLAFFIFLFDCFCMVYMHYRQKNPNFLL